MSFIHKLALGFIEYKKCHGKYKSHKEPAIPEESVGKNSPSDLNHEEDLMKQSNPFERPSQVSMDSYLKWLQAQNTFSTIGLSIASGDALLLRCEHWLEAADEHHRHGSNLRPYFDYWSEYVSGYPRPLEQLPTVQQNEGGACEERCGEASTSAPSHDRSPSVATKGRHLNPSANSQQRKVAASAAAAAAAAQSKKWQPAGGWQKVLEAVAASSILMHGISSAPVSLSSSPKASISGSLEGVGLGFEQTMTVASTGKTMLSSRSSRYGRGHGRCRQVPDQLMKNRSCLSTMHPSLSVGRNLQEMGVPLEGMGLNVGIGLRGTIQKDVHRHSYSLGMGDGSVKRINGVVKGLSEASMCGLLGQEVKADDSSHLDEPTLTARDDGLEEATQSEEEEEEEEPMGFSEEEEVAEVVGDPVADSPDVFCLIEDERQGAGSGEASGSVMGYSGSGSGEASGSVMGYSEDMGEIELLADSPGLLSSAEYLAGSYEADMSLTVADPSNNFFLWLDHGDGRSLDLGDLPGGVSRSKLESERVRYLTPNELPNYEVVVERSTGLLLYKASGQLLHTFGLVSSGGAIEHAEPSKKKLIVSLPGNSETQLEGSAWDSFVQNSAEALVPTSSSSTLDVPLSSRNSTVHEALVPTSSSSTLDVPLSSRNSTVHEAQHSSADADPKASTSKVDERESPLNQQDGHPLPEGPQEEVRDTTEAGDSKVDDASKESTKWIWVVGSSGRLYVHPKVRGKFHHSSFVRGSVVLAAGNMLVHHGRLVGLTADSGHYWPQPGHFRWFYDRLDQQGADLSALQGLDFTTKH
ncbi:hypothetical protein CEUSTIGMA_g10592.t1 [Chlamydomonas eustigma]|uniref:Uncharacterized protein n=1 Tax=Chlamydomonas eustigma TaxID=1157962 RepID=A0A250XJH1_9CHLO|nr:hypothetical protein CEUSTIGMA_g10592.t1 [Chlamydomonas eustigma]|eukprot:GAX83166.1 hypothetical protein CEUSTIGMA_g10592.t1 [Chlamydomonas eustigma]